MGVSCLAKDVARKIKSSKHLSQDRSSHTTQKMPTLPSLSSERSRSRQLPPPSPAATQYRRPSSGVWGRLRAGGGIRSRSNSDVDSSYGYGPSKASSLVGGSSAAPSKALGGGGGVGGAGGGGGGGGVGGGGDEDGRNSGQYDFAHSRQETEHEIKEKYNTQYIVYKYKYGVSYCCTDSQQQQQPQQPQQPPQQQQQQRQQCCSSSIYLSPRTYQRMMNINGSDRFCG